MPVSAGIGPTPTLPAPEKSLIPVVNVVDAKGWAPNADAGRRGGHDGRTPSRRGLDHPRWLYVLPNGDVLVAETNAPPRPDDGKGIKGWFFKHFQKKAGGAVPSANRITLLRDADGDGVAETQPSFSTGLNVAVRHGARRRRALRREHRRASCAFPTSAGDTTITAPATKVVDLPADRSTTTGRRASSRAPTDRSCTSASARTATSRRTGSTKEEGRAAIWEIDPATRRAPRLRVGLRNPVGMAWEPDNGALWVAVNERDELGSDLVPDYMTSVRDGGFYGWPYSYYGQHVDDRVKPAAPGSRREGDRARLRARPAHRVARPRVVGLDHAPAPLHPRDVRRPARLVEPQAAERLQGDLRSVRRREASVRPSTC